MYKNKFNSLTIVIPSYNELKNFKKKLIQLNSKYKILVIDDGSTDGTINFLKKYKINYISNYKNLGYEESLKKAINYLINKKKTKYVLTMDADNQHKIMYISKIYDYIIKHNADLVIGARIKKNRYLEEIISKLCNLKFNFTDPLSGFKIYKIDKIKKINLKKIKNFFLVDLVMFALEKKLKIINMSIATNKRKDKPRVGNFFSSNLKLIKILINLFFRN